MSDPLPSGFLQTLNEQQEGELKKLQERVKDVSFLQNHPDGDAYLLRFLRATMEKKKSDRIFHVDNWGKKKQGAYERIMEAVEFYEKWDLDKAPPKYEEYRRLRPDKVWFDPKAQQLVVCEKSALFLSHTSPRALTEEEWTACIAYRIEELERQVRQVRKEHGLDDRPVVAALQDITGLKLSVLSMRPIFALNDRVFASHHPECLAKAYVVNAPWLFERIYQIVKQIVDADTIAKVEILAKSYRLLDVFEGIQVPEEYGGEGENVPIPSKARGRKVSKNVQKTSPQTFVEKDV